MTEDIESKFIERTKYHIALVNKYAQKLGLSFPQHDASKLNDLLFGYCYFIVPQEQRTQEEEHLLDICTLIHIKNSPHHPEYWTDTDLTGFTRVNYTPNGPIDATQMPDECICEMVCDWMAVSEEKGNTCTWWFNQVNNKRWIFSPHQQELILQLIKQLGE